MLWILLVLYGLSESTHNVQLFESQDTQPFHQPSQAVRRAFPLPVVVRLQQELQQFADQGWGIRFDGWDQGRQAVCYSFLDLGKREGNMDYLVPQICKMNSRFQS